MCICVCVASAHFPHMPTRLSRDCEPVVHGLVWPGLRPVFSILFHHLTLHLGLKSSWTGCALLLIGLDSVLLVLLGCVCMIFCSINRLLGFPQFKKKKKKNRLLGRKGKTQYMCTIHLYKNLRESNSFLFPSTLNGSVMIFGKC